MSNPPNESTNLRIAFLGPVGTFGEEALRTIDDLGDIEAVPMRTMPDVLTAVTADEADLGLVALENSIEGTVNVSLDALIFDNDLLIKREIVMPIVMCLIAPKGLKVKDIKRVISFPVAAAQCRDYLGKYLPHAEMVAANSTAEAVRQVSRSKSANTAALGPRLSAEIYGMNVVEADIADHQTNETRFVLVGKEGIPARTGHDKTSIVVFQASDKPGNLHSILGQFSARNINLMKLESRPTKQGLGDYCFVIDLEGHIDEEVIADCLRDLHVQLRDLKYLGSYPAAGTKGPRRRREAVAAWRQADEWVSTLRGQVAPHPKRSRLKVVK